MGDQIKDHNMTENTPVPFAEGMTVTSKLSPNSPPFVLTKKHVSGMWESNGGLIDESNISHLPAPFKPGQEVYRIFETDGGQEVERIALDKRFWDSNLSAWWWESEDGSSSEAILCALTDLRPGDEVEIVGPAYSNQGGAIGNRITIANVFTSPDGLTGFSATHSVPFPAASLRLIRRPVPLAPTQPCQPVEGEIAALKAEVRELRDMVWNTMGKYSEALGWGLSSSQPECWMMLDLAVEKLARIEKANQPLKWTICHDTPYWSVGAGAYGDGNPAIANGHHDDEPKWLGAMVASHNSAIAAAYAAWAKSRDGELEVMTQDRDCLKSYLDPRSELMIQHFVDGMKSVGGYDDKALADLVNNDELPWGERMGTTVGALVAERDTLKAKLATLETAGDGEPKPWAPLIPETFSVQVGEEPPYYVILADAEQMDDLVKADAAKTLLWRQYVAKRAAEAVRGEREALATFAKDWLDNWASDLTATRDAYIVAQSTGVFGESKRKILPGQAIEFAREFRHRAEAIAMIAPDLAAAIRARGAVGEGGAA